MLKNFFARKFFAQGQKELKKVFETIELRSATISAPKISWFSTVFVTCVAKTNLIVTGVAKT